MPIILKHGGNPASALVGAYGGGKGRRQAEDSRLAMQLADNEKSRRAALQRQDDVQAHADKARQLELDETRRRDELLYDRQGERDDLLFDRQQRLAETSQEQARENFMFELTARQEAELEQLANAEAEMLASDDYTPEEKAELRRRFTAKRAGIKPVERPRKQTPAEIFESKTYRDPKTGAIYPLDEQGQPGRPIYEPPEREPTWQDRVKAFTAATAFATGDDGKVDPVKFKEAMRQMGMQQEEPAKPEDMFSLPPLAPGAITAPGAVKSASVGIIAGFPTDLWGRMDDDDREAVWKVFKSGKTLGEIVNIVRKGLK